MTLRKAGCMLVATALLLSDPSGVRAQQTNNSFGETFDVRVTNVDVHATDSKGNPVSGLTKDDFEIYENGKRQEITNFYEMTAAQTALASAEGAAQLAAPASSAGRIPRKYIFYVDNGTLSMKNRDDIFTGITEFLATNLAPGDAVMIVNWSGSLHVRLPWSSDRNAINATFKTIASELGTAGQIQAEKQRAIRQLRQLENASKDSTSATTYQSVEGAVRSYAESVRFDITQSVGAMTKLLSSLSGVEGKKILILATESLPTQAGAEMFQAFDNVRTRSALDTGISQTTPTDQNGMGGLSAPPPGATLSQGSRVTTRISDLSKYNVSPMIDALGRMANATGVTVYAINPKGTSGDAAGNADKQESSDSGMEFVESTQIVDGVNVLATRTGGVASIGAPAKVALATLTRDLGSYYSLGYRTGPGGSPDRKVEVKIKRRGVTARYRNTIFYRSLQTEMADRVIANHLESELANPLGILLQTEAVKTEGAQQLLPMMVIIPADSLTLVPDAEGNVSGGFSVFTSAGDADGNVGGVNVQSQQIKWPKEQAAQMKGRRIGFAVKVPMDANPKQISVGVVDQLSQTQGFAVIKVAK